VGSTSGGRARMNGRVAAKARRGVIALLGLAWLACGQAAPGGRAVENREGSRTATLAGDDAARSVGELLRVGTSGDYAPFSLWSDGEPEPRGFSAEVARAFAQDRGRRIEWVRFRWPELEADLAAGRFEIALSGITIRPDRSLAGRFGLPLTATGAVALVRADSALRERGDLDRPGIRLAVNRGGHLERVARSLFPRAAIEAIGDNARIAERLFDGRAEAVLTDDLEAPHWQAGHPPSRVIGPLTRDLKAAWLPPGREGLAHDFDRWLLRFETTGALAQLRERHGLSPARTAEPLPALLASLDERLSLMPAVARAKGVLGRPIQDEGQEARVHEAVQQACLRAGRELTTRPPAEASIRRFVDAQLRAARFVQERELATVASMSTPSPATPAAIPGAMPRDAARRELDQRIRPALAFVTERVAWLLVAASKSAGTDPSPRADLPPTRDEVAKALARHALPSELEAEIHASLEALFTPPPSARRAAPTPPARSAPRGITTSG